MKPISWVFSSACSRSCICESTTTMICRSDHHACQQADQRNEADQWGNSHQQEAPILDGGEGFLPVGQIKLGMHVVEAEGQLGVISGWKVVAGVKVMYNLEVAQDHTFVVGVGMWVVHNCGPVSPGDAGAYKDLKGVPGDGLTAHHMPGQALAGHFGYTVPSGGAIVMDEDTHALTYNFRYKGIAVTRNIVENEVGFRSALAESIRDYRNLVPNSNESVRNLIEYWRIAYPDLMSK